MGLSVTFEGDRVDFYYGNEFQRSHRFPQMQDLKQKSLASGDFVEFCPVSTVMLDEDYEENDEDKDKFRSLRESIQITDSQLRRAPPDGKLRFGISYNSFENTTSEQLKKDYELEYLALKQSDDYEALVSKFRASTTAQDIQVTNVVALGIGSMHTIAGHEGSWTRSRQQLAAVMAIREVFGQQANPLPCVVQDPAYSKLEVEFLQSLGLSVLDDPDAFGAINANSLVFNIGTYLSLAYSISLQDWPALMICSNWGDPLGNLLNHYPTVFAERTHFMFQHYDRIELVEEQNTDSMWYGTQLYRRNIDAQ